MTEFKTVTDSDLLKATLFNRCRLADSGCWIWTSHKRNGYGLFYVDSKTQSAHRVSYELFKGHIDAGMHILHSCDNPACVNPDHLRQGTVKENMADREARGRRDVRGEQIGTSKLKEEDIVRIRRSVLPIGVLARWYGVDKSNIWAIRARKIWKHIAAAAGVNYGY